jgi:hypothetical protein
MPAAAAVPSGMAMSAAKAFFRLQRIAGKPPFLDRFSGEATGGMVVFRSVPVVMMHVV